MTGDQPECHLVCIPPDKVALVWPLARNLIFAAMKRGDLSSFGPVEDSVLRGDALLWLALTYEDGDGVRIDAAAVTELHRTEWRKVCVVVACGAPSGRLGASGRLRTSGRSRASGRLRPSSRAVASRAVASRATDRRRWIGLLERIEEFARAEGCEATRIIGRKGWARVLTSYQTKRIVLEKDL
jgi:GNAT superfamily N-acetyltransferase